MQLSAAKKHPQSAQGARHTFAGCNTASHVIMGAISLCIPELCLWKAEVAAACLEAPVAPLAVSRLDILDHL